MKERYKRQTHMGTIGDLKNLEIHFANMAQQGWMIDKIGLWSHRYRAVTPCKKHFFVDLLPQITAFDYPENEDAQDYRRICEESGWRFVTANKQFHVFCAEGDTAAPVSIHTDNSIQAQIYLKFCKKYELLPFCIPIFMLVWLFIMQVAGKGPEVFLSNLFIFQSIGNFFFFIGYGWMLGFVLLWYKRTKKSARECLPLPTVNYKLARIRGTVFSVSAVILVLCLLLGIVLEFRGGMVIALLLVLALPGSALLIGFWIRRQIDTKRRERKANIKLFIAALVVAELIAMGLLGLVAYQAINLYQNTEIIDNRQVLYLSDIGLSVPPDRSGSWERGSLAVPLYYSYWERNKENGVSTTVYRTVSKTLTQQLYRHYAKELINRYSDRIDGVNSIPSFTIDNAWLWGADEGVAIERSWGGIELVLRRDTTLLQLSIEKKIIFMSDIMEAVKKLW